MVVLMMIMGVLHVGGHSNQGERSPSTLTQGNTCGIGNSAIVSLLIVVNFAMRD